VGTTSLSQTITLSNKSDAAVSLSAIYISGADAADFHQTHTCGTSVASGASCFIKVTFKPSAKGTRTADVSVYDNGGGSPQQVSLTGTGT
jgi:Abnormal spindle-like microcephaly-assoc'd, ASPM-SPD-2-Hydin